MMWPVSEAFLKEARGYVMDAYGLLWPFGEKRLPKPKDDEDGES